MAFLLKIKRSALTSGYAVVPKMKSIKLSAASVGADVFVWFDDGLGSKSSLEAVCSLVGFEETEIPQVRDATKMKAAYRLHLCTSESQIAQPLSTDDLEPHRYSNASGGLASLGKIHRDRNDKIIALSPAEASALAARFR